LRAMFKINCFASVKGGPSTSMSGREQHQSQNLGKKIECIQIY